VHVTVVLPDEPGNAAERLRSEDVVVVELAMHRIQDQLNPGVQLRFLRAFRGDIRRLRGLIRKSHADVVLVNGLINPHAAVAARLEGVPIVWQLLDTVPPAWYRRLMMPLVLRWAGAIMTSGRAVAAAHPGVERFPGPVVSFFPAVDLERFRPDPSRRRHARSALGLLEREMVVGNVGNLVPLKGHLNFVRAAAHLRQTHPDVRFVILGNAPTHRTAYIEELLDLARSLGLKPGRDLIVRDPGPCVAELASAFDVFWLTSDGRSEGLTTVIGEAMALKIPVVAVNVGAVSEAVEDGVTGYLVNHAQPQELAAKTRPLLDDPSLRARIGETARARGAIQWNAKRAAEQHHEMFDVAAAHK
jgi:glycosyltransferase involved in cell wall biosynthesis